MFYSQLILAKKGPLGRIWLAAHFQKKLNKKEIFSTSIHESVESIISPDEPLSLRVSGHLLLGVVRIFSKKCHFLAADCRDARLKLLHAFRSAKNRVDMNPEEQKGKRLDIPEFQVNYGMDDDIFEQDGDAGITSNTGDDDFSSASDEESWKTGMFVNRNIASSDADILMHSDDNYGNMGHMHQSDMSDIGGGGDDGFGEDGGFDESLEYGRDGHSMGGFNGGDESFGNGGSRGVQVERMSLASMGSNGGIGAGNAEDGFGNGFDERGRNPVSPHGNQRRVSGSSFLSPMSSNASGANAPSPGGGLGIQGVDDSLLSAAKAAAAKAAMEQPEQYQSARKRAKRARPAVKFDRSTMMTKSEMERRRDNHEGLVSRRGISDTLLEALPPTPSSVDQEDSESIAEYSRKRRQFSEAAAIVTGFQRKKRKKIRMSDMMRRPASGNMHPRLMALFASVATNGPLPFRNHHSPPLPGSPAAAAAAHSSSLALLDSRRRSSIELGRDGDDRRVSGGLDRSEFSAVGDGDRRNTMADDDFGGYDADDADGFGGGFDDDFGDVESGMQNVSLQSPSAGGAAGELGGEDLGVMNSAEKERPLHRQIKRMLAKLGKIRRASLDSMSSSSSTSDQGFLNFNRVVAPCKTAEDAAKCFMDLLTLCGRGEIALRQDESYGNIEIRLK